MMKQPERDNLLIDMRVEQGKQGEGIRNIWRVVEKLEEHQETQNGFILENMKATAKNTMWRRTIMGIGGVSVAGLSSWLAKLQGWW